MRTRLIIICILVTNAAFAQWARITGSPSEAHRIYFYSPLLGYALKGDEIFKTTDGGATWSNAPTGLSSFDNIVDIYFATPDTGFISVQNGMTFSYPVSIYKTINAGATWSLLLGPFNHCEIDFHIAGQNDWYFYLNTSMLNADTIFHTPNAGATWSNTANANRVQYNQAINNLVVYRDSVNTQASTNLFYKSTNGGAGWSLLLTDNTPASAFIDRQFLNNNLGYVLLYQYNATDSIPSKLYKTANGGQSWAGYDLPPGCSGPQAVHFVSATTGYILSHDTNQSTVFKTSDGGQTWNPDLTGLAAEYFFGVDGISEYFGRLYVLGNTIISNQLLVTAVKRSAQETTGFKVFPNPSNGHVEILRARAEQEGHYAITDLCGRELQSFSIEREGSATIDISNLSSGIYFLTDRDSLQAIRLIKE